MNQLAVVCCLLLAGAVGPANAADWKMDPSGSRLEFIAAYERATAPGLFREFDTRLRFDPERLAESRIDVTIATGSAEMRSDVASATLHAPEWLDVARFPRAGFYAASVRGVGANRYVAAGTLRLKGIERLIEVPFTWTAAGATATMQGDLTINRLAFGIGGNEAASTRAIVPIVGADVRLRFRILLIAAGVSSARQRD